MEKDVSSYCVQRLREDSEYMFRVIAENPVGTSEALESETITVRSKFGEFIFGTLRIIQLQLQIQLQYLCSPLQHLIKLTHSNLL